MLITCFRYQPKRIGAFPQSRQYGKNMHVDHETHKTMEDEGAVFKLSRYPDITSININPSCSTTQPYAPAVLCAMNRRDALASVRSSQVNKPVYKHHAVSPSTHLHRLRLWLHPTTHFPTLRNHGKDTNHFKHLNPTPDQLSFKPHPIASFK